MDKRKVTYMEKKNILQKAFRVFDIPEDIKGGSIHIELCGRNEVFVENHKGILTLSETEVEISAGKESLRVTGVDLSVLAMNADEVRICGNIESVHFGKR